MCVPKQTFFSTQLKEVGKKPHVSKNILYHHSDSVRVVPSYRNDLLDSTHTMKHVCNMDANGRAAHRCVSVANFNLHFLFSRSSLQPLLLLAIEEGDPDVIAAMIKQNVNAFEKDKRSQYTALITAIIEDQPGTMFYAYIFIYTPEYIYVSLDI